MKKYFKISKNVKFKNIKYHESQNENREKISKNQKC